MPRNYRSDGLQIVLGITAGAVLVATTVMFRDSLNGRENPVTSYPTPTPQVEYFSPESEIYHLRNVYDFESQLNKY